MVVIISGSSSSRYRSAGVTAVFFLPVARWPISACTGVRRKGVGLYRAVASRWWSRSALLASHDAARLRRSSLRWLKLDTPVNYRAQRGSSTAVFLVPQSGELIGGVS